MAKIKEFEEDREILKEKKRKIRHEEDEDMGDEELLRKVKSRIDEDGFLDEEYNLSPKDLPEGWEIIEKNKMIRISKKFHFENIIQAAEFINKVAIASKNLHPPNITFIHNEIQIEVHSTGADFSNSEIQLIRKIDSFKS